MIPRRSMVLALALTFGLGACGDSDPTGVDDDEGPGNGAREVLSNPSFSADVQDILQRNGCTASGCHGTGAGGLTLGSSAATNYSNLVGVASGGEPTFDLVAPGDAQNSYVVIKVEGRQSVGQRMPIGQPALDDIDIANLRNWINNGAPEN